MSYLQEKFQSLTKNDQDVLLDLLSNLTEGDLRRVCRDQLMDGADTRQMIEAHERFQNAGS